MGGGGDKCGGSMWVQEAERLKFEENKSWSEVARAVAHYFPELSDQQVLEKVRAKLRRSKQYKKTPDAKIDVVEVLKKGTTIQELSNQLNISTKACNVVLEDLTEQGYNILHIGDDVRISQIIVPERNEIHNNWNGEKIIRFGLMGDTQINSKYTQLTHLHKLYDIYTSEGITDVYHTGDIDEGEQMRVGHQYECYTQGADDHTAEIVRVYPKRNGMTTHFITGNHDHSIIKRCGYDIGYKIAQEREDMKYLGKSDALIYLTDNCTMELSHPIDGSAYAISYKIQKSIDAMSGGEKPNILAVGHYHKSESIFYRNVHAFQTGCLQAQTPFMRGKQLAAHMGGWIIEAHVDEQGIITRLKSEFIPFYTAIVNDYLNWR